MTSGHFKAYPVDQIWVDRQARQRRELKNIPELAESIRAQGLINPLTVTREGRLVAGERRLTAVKQLGWSAVPIQFVDETSEDQLHLIELEENIKRVDISWQEQCLAIERYQQLLQGTDRPSTAEKIADEMGMVHQTVSRKLMVAKALKEGNPLVASAATYSTALGIVERAQARKSADATRTIMTDALKVITPNAPAPVAPTVPLLHTSFRSWLDTYDGPQFNLIHCDFPYGVGMHDSDQGSGDGFGTYKDTKEVYFNLLGDLDLAMSSVIADSAHLIFWFSMDYYTDTRYFLEQMGWSISPFPLIWHKSDNIGILPDPKRGPRRIYETAFFGSRGDRPVVRSVSNVFSCPGRDKTLHMNEKPVAMLKYFMGMVCDEYSTVLDPTCGSANAIRAAQQLAAAAVLGLEIDKEFFNRAKEAFLDAV